MQGYAIGKPDPPAHGLTSVDIVAREVNAGYAALMPLRDETRSPTEATADVQHVVCSRQVQLRDQLFGRIPAPDVKLVDRSKVGNGHGARGLTERGHAVTDRVDQVVAGI